MDDRENFQNLSLELRTKIITLRNYTSKTWAEIARETHCSVSERKMSLYVMKIFRKNICPQFAVKFR